MANVIGAGDCCQIIVLLLISGDLLCQEKGL